jgi:hypothetical protein
LTTLCGLLDGRPPVTQIPLIGFDQALETALPLGFCLPRCHHSTSNVVVRMPVSFELPRCRRNYANACTMNCLANAVYRPTMKLSKLHRNLPNREENSPTTCAFARCNLVSPCFF